MIIELTGPPGAGKSTIVRQLLNLFREENLLLLSNQEALGVAFRRLTGKIPLPDWLRRPLWHLAMIWSIISFSIEHFSLFRVVLTSQYNRPISWRLRLWILHLAVRRWGHYRLLHRYLKPNEAVLFDGGILHFNVTLFVSEQGPYSFDNLRKYVQFLPQPDLLILLEISPVLSYRRMTIRNRVLTRRMKKLSPEVAASFVRYQSEAISAAVREAQHCGWTVQIVDNSVPLPEAVSRISELLRRLVNVTI